MLVPYVNILLQICFYLTQLSLWIKTVMTLLLMISDFLNNFYETSFRVILDISLL